MKNHDAETITQAAEEAQDPANQGDIPAPSPVAPPLPNRPFHEPGVCMGTPTCKDPFHDWFEEDGLPKS